MRLQLASRARSFSAIR